jgi:hypothetical protein
MTLHGQLEPALRADRRAGECLVGPWLLVQPDAVVRPRDGGMVYRYGDVAQLGAGSLGDSAGPLPDLVDDLSGGFQRSGFDLRFRKQQEEILRFSNGIANTLAVDASVFLSQTLVEWLKEHNDPRLRVYGAVLPDGYGAGNIVITDPDQQLGRPNGWLTAEVEDHPSWPGDINLYSRAHPRFLDVTNPTFFQTYAEVSLMQAEMAARGWTGDSGELHYNNGVRAAMEYLALYSGSDAVITDDEINDYLSVNPYNSAGSLEERLEQIHSQYWAALFWNGFEAWANFRRTGYPVLDRSPVDSDQPHPANATGGDFPARLTYPEGERVLNQSNFDEMIQRQGSNTLSTRVWWDPGRIYMN